MILNISKSTHFANMNLYVGIRVSDKKADRRISRTPRAARQLPDSILVLWSQHMNTGHEDIPH